MRVPSKAYVIKLFASGRPSLHSTTSGRNVSWLYIHRTRREMSIEEARRPRCTYPNAEISMYITLYVKALLLCIKRAFSCLRSLWVRVRSIWFNDVVCAVSMSRGIHVVTSRVDRVLPDKTLAYASNRLSSFFHQLQLYSLCIFYAWWYLGCTNVSRCSRDMETYTRQLLTYT